MSKGWSREFDEPIPVPKGEPLITLRDAGEYIRKLPKKRQADERWHMAAQALLLVVNANGMPLLAEIAMRQALGSPREY